MVGGRHSENIILQQEQITDSIYNGRDNTSGIGFISMVTNILVLEMKEYKY